MTDLVSAVPPHEPAEDTLAYVGKAALGAIPIVGPIAAETLAHVLDTRQAARQHEFNSLMARSLTDAIARLDESLTLEDVVDSDEFVAAVTHAQRAAAETASAGKRRRLANAVAHAGSWAPFSLTERSQFGRLVVDFDDLHVWLLHYLDDGHAWATANGVDMARRYEADNNNSLTAVFGVPLAEWWPPFAQAVSDLERERLVAIQRELSDSHARELHARTTPKGRKFLEYLSEPPSAEAAPPSAL
jgi:hypothetical protein